jgi:hypothetical protein
MAHPTKIQAHLNTFFDENNFSGKFVSLTAPLVVAYGNTRSDTRTRTYRTRTHARKYNS